MEIHLRLPVLAGFDEHIGLVSNIAGGVNGVFLALLDVLTNLEVTFS